MQFAVFAGLGVEYENADFDIAGVYIFKIYGFGGVKGIKNLGLGGEGRGVENN